MRAQFAPFEIRFRFSGVQPIKKEHREDSFARKHHFFNGVYSKEEMDVVDVIETDEAVQQNKNSRPVLPLPKEPQYDVANANCESEDRDEKEYGKPCLMRFWFQQDCISENVENGHKPC
jgi:hypothetical protein